MTNFLQRVFSRKTGKADPNNSTLYRIGPTVADVNVDESSALTYSAVFAAVNYISRCLGLLSWHVYSNDGNKRILEDKHPVDPIIHVAVNDEITSDIFRETLTGHTLTWGNGYAEIEKLRSGKLGALHLITPDRVNPDRDSRKNLIYDISNDSSANTVLSKEKIFHVKGLSYDGLVGYSPITLARESIALGLAMQNYGAAFFGNNAEPGGIIEVAGTLKQEAFDRLVETWEDKHKGSKKAHKVAVLEGGAKWTQLGLKPEDAQFLNSREFQIQEIARWFSLPPHKLAELSHGTFSNIEELNISVVGDAIVPWANRWENEANFKLFDQRGRYYTKLNLKSLLRGDTKSRGEFYKTMFNCGAYSPNKILECEDENPVPGGDIRMVPMNMMTLEQAAEGKNLKSDTKSSDNKIISARVFESILSRLHAKEHNAVGRLIKKHKDDFEELNRSVTQFFHTHIEHITENLMAPAVAFVEQYGNGVPVNVAEEINAFAVEVSDESCQSAMELQLPQNKSVYHAQVLCQRLSTLCINAKMETRNVS